MSCLLPLVRLCVNVPPSLAVGVQTAARQSHCQRPLIPIFGATAKQRPELGQISRGIGSATWIRFAPPIATWPGSDLPEIRCACCAASWRQSRVTIQRACASCSPPGMGSIVFGTAVDYACAVMTV